MEDHRVNRGSQKKWWRAVHHQQLEKTKKSLDAKLKKLLSRGRKDDIIAFEQPSAEHYLRLDNAEKTDHIQKRNQCRRHIRKRRRAQHFFRAVKLFFRKNVLIFQRRKRPPRRIILYRQRHYLEYKYTNKNVNRNIECSVYILKKCPISVSAKADTMRR